MQSVAFLITESHVGPRAEQSCEVASLSLINLGVGPGLRRAYYFLVHQ